MGEKASVICIANFSKDLEPKSVPDHLLIIFFKTLKNINLLAFLYIKIISNSKYLSSRSLMPLIYFVWNFW